MGLLIDLCRAKESLLWDELQKLDLAIDDDIDNLTKFLTDEFYSLKYFPPPFGRKSIFRSPIGIALLLNTINMESRASMNVEIDIVEGVSEFQSKRWIENIDYSGYRIDSYLLRELLYAKRLYNQKQYRTDGVSSFADYYLFLGYAGIVFSEIFSRRLSPFPHYGVAWGFHDGDIYMLGQDNGEGFVINIQALE